MVYMLSGGFTRYARSTPAKHKGTLRVLRRCIPFVITLCELKIHSAHINKTPRLRVRLKRESLR